MVFPKCLLSSAAYKISICIHLKPVKYASSWSYLIMLIVWQEGKFPLKLQFTTLVLLETIFFIWKVGRKKTSWSIFRVSWNTSTSMCTWIRFMSLIKTRRVCKILLNNLWQAPPNLSFLGHHQHTCTADFSLMCLQVGMCRRALVILSCRKIPVTPGIGPIWMLMVSDFT